jgi:hypothetical protein
VQITAPEGGDGWLFPSLRAIRAATGLSLKDAKAFLDKARGRRRSVPWDAQLADELRSYGWKVTLEPEDGQNIRKALVEASGDEELLFADGWDDCIVGLAVDFGKPLRVVYNRTRMIRVMMDRDGATYEEAVEHLSFNVEGAYVGERTPIYLDPVETLLED